MTNTEMRVNYTMMKALRDLRRLQHLSREVSTLFALDPAGFEDLVASWPALHGLVLEDTTAFPTTTVLLPLTILVATLRRFCPTRAPLAACVPHGPVDVHSAVTGPP